MALVLGFCSSHDASACAFRDGELVAAISEERLSRIKTDGNRLPQLAIDAVLKMAGATRRDVDHIAMTYNHVPERYCRRTTLRKEVERLRAEKLPLGPPIVNAVPPRRFLPEDEAAIDDLERLGRAHFAPPDRIDQ